MVIPIKNNRVLSDGGDSIYDDSGEDYIMGGGEFWEKKSDLNEIMDWDWVGKVRQAKRLYGDGVSESEMARVL